MEENDINPDAIAIIGIACKFPGASNKTEFWKNLASGKESISHFTDEELYKSGIDPSIVDAPNYIKVGGVIDDIDKFDAAFFGYSTNEAEIIDPQQRLFLQTAWNAIEDAGYNPDNYDGSIGVFASSKMSTYMQRINSDVSNLGTSTSFQMLIGNDKDYVSTRTGYKLNLKGPCLTIQTACSSSLVAVHVAAESVRNGECDMALAGGVGIIVPQNIGYLYQEGMIFSSDGHCRTFDDKADGMVLGNGVGVVMLKRLGDAIRDKDNIYAVILGSAINNDGVSKAGFTAPSIEGQTKVISEAISMANISAESITMIECHGTATNIGDPIEISALTSAFESNNSTKTNYCAVGSVKTNIGHLDTAAGIAGFIKTVLSLHNKQIPPSLNFETPNSKINFDITPFYVSQKLTDWNPDNKIRRAGVSAFGIGGTNAHLVLEEAPVFANRATSKNNYFLFTLSAKSETALKNTAKNYANFLKNKNLPSIEDICFTSNVGRKHFNYRLVFVVTSHKDLESKLAEFISGETTCNNVDVDSYKPLVFMYTGQGAQYIGMCQTLYNLDETFRDAFDKCDHLFQKYLKESLIDILWTRGEEELFNVTKYAQPIVFTTEYALTTYWKKLGIEPSYVIGHSLGEYIAACIAGIFSIEDAIKLIYHRSSLMQALPNNGGMYAVIASKETVEGYLAKYKDSVSIASVNSPNNVIISGLTADILKIAASMEADNIIVKELSVTQASHSPLMEPLFDKFRSVLNEIEFHEPIIPLPPDTTNETSTSKGQSSPDYWINHFRQTVFFSNRLNYLFDNNCSIFLEIGSSLILASMGKQHANDNITWLNSLQRGIDDELSILTVISELYKLGLTINFDNLFYSTYAHRVSMPGYAYDKVRYWCEDDNKNNLRNRSQKSSKYKHPLIDCKLPIALPVFETSIGLEKIPFLAHHVAYGSPIVPATFYIELALSAYKYQFNEQCSLLKDITLFEPLIINSPSDFLTIQVFFENSDSDTSSFKIYSMPDSDDNSWWKLHASGKISQQKNDSTGDANTTLDSLKQQITNEINPEKIYADVLSRGIEYGPTFQGIKKAWSINNEALAFIDSCQIVCPENDLENQEYIFHPAKFDACLQTIVATSYANSGENSNDAFMPIGFDGIKILCNNLPDKIWVYCNRKESANSANTLIADYKLFNNDGVLIAEIHNLIMNRAKKSQFLRVKPNELMYHVKWDVGGKIDQLKNVTSGKGSYILFSNNKNLGAQLFDNLNIEKNSRICVQEGKDFQKISNNEYSISPSNYEDYNKLLADVKLLGDINCIIHAWSLDIKPITDNFDIIKEQDKGCISLMNIVKSLVNTLDGEQEPGIFIYTSGASVLPGDVNVLHPTQAPLWGLFKTINNEYRQWNTKIFDIDPLANEQGVITAISGTINNAIVENQAIWRDQHYYYPRLTSIQLNTSGTPQSLTIENKGILDSLEYTECQRKRPDKGEVEIRVHSTGVNFRDVMIAMGVYPGDNIPLGMDFTGQIVSVGEGVKDFAVGQRVFATQPDCFKTHVTTSAENIIELPANIDYNHALCVTNYLTVYYSIVELAKLSKGQRILIHSASGGIGLAAIAIAQKLGAEIYVTAGNERKRNYLKSLNLKYVGDSRNTNYAEEISELTKNKGVDIILNSLTGEAVIKNIQILKNGGHCVELGKFDLLSDEQLKQYKKSINYHIVDIEKVGKDNPILLKNTLRDIFEKFGNGELIPVLTNVYPKEDIADVFRNMANARHIGKIVISQSEASLEEGTVQDNILGKNFIITGGYGGIAVELAKWLVDKGSGKIFLLGRNSSPEKLESVKKDIASYGEKIQTKNTDITSESEFISTLDEISSISKIHGVLHLAGVISDAVLTNQDNESFTKVLSPKLEGGLNIFKHIKKYKPEFVVLFSSTAALYGPSGQSNHASANIFLDVLAHSMRNNGINTISINWGAWDKVGIFSQNQKAQRSDIMGMQALDPTIAFDVLDKCIKLNMPQIGVMSMNWGMLSEKLGGSTPPFLMRVIGKTRKITGRNIYAKEINQVLEKLKQPQNGNTSDLLKSFIKYNLADLLRMDVANIKDNDDLIVLGLDSLMFLQLTQKISKGLSVKISSRKAFENRTINKLVAYLITDFQGVTGASGATSTLSVVEDLEHRYEDFPLTDIQFAYWIGRRRDFELGNNACHIYHEIDCQGLNIEKFNYAWNLLVKRHEMLRAIVTPDGNQLILKETPEYIIKTIDLNDKSEADKDSILFEIRETMSHHMYKPEEWPLFGIRASIIDKSTTRLHIGFDLLITDLWSTQLILKELAAFYQTPNLKLEPLTLSFRDYVNTSLTLNEHDDYIRSKEYWQSRIGSIPPAPELTLSKSPKSITKPKFVRRQFILDKSIWSNLKKIGSDYGLTSSGIVFSVFAEIIKRWSKNQNFTINLTIFNRLPLHKEVMQIVGDFTSIILVEVNNNNYPTFAEKAKALQEQLWKDIDNKHYSGIEVLRELGKTDTDGSYKTMPVVFTSAIGQDDIENQEAMSVFGDVTYAISQTPQVWIDNQVFEQSGELKIIWDVVEELFPERLIDDMFNNFHTLLLKLSADSGLWKTEKFELLPKYQEEQRTLTNSTFRKINNSLLHAYFVNQINVNPNNIAVITSSKQITYNELHRYASHIAEKLQKNGASANQFVGVLLPKGWEQIASVMGILYSSAAYLPISADLPADRVKNILVDAKVKQVITTLSIAKELSIHEEYKIIDIETIDIAKTTKFAIDLSQPNTDLAYVIYTSGSTGMPKGVLIDHRGALNTILDINSKFDIESGDKTFLLSSLNFDLSVYDIFGALSVGAAIVIPESSKQKDPAHWLEICTKNNVTIWNSVPALMEMLVTYSVNSNKPLPESLRLVLMSGDWIPVSLPDRIKQQKPDINVISLGGATEASIWSIYYPIKQVNPEWKSIPYGKPLINQSFHILNNQLQDCPDWVTGHLYIGGIGVAKGYWNDTDKTAKSFVKHPKSGEIIYRTGDLGRYFPDGNIEFLGREDFQVKINGYRIELGEIEESIKGQRGVKDALVKVHENDSKSKRLVSYIIADSCKSILTPKEATAPTTPEKNWETMIVAGDTQACDIPKEIEPESFLKFWTALQALSTQYMIKALSELGLFQKANECYTLDTICHKCSISPKCHKILGQWLKILVEDGYLKLNGNSEYTNPSILKEIDTTDLWEQIKQFANWGKGAKEILNYLELCSNNLSKLLTGELDPLKIFFPDGDWSTAESLYRYNPVSMYHNNISAFILKNLAGNYNEQRKLKILEVGAGTGGTSAAILSMLPSDRVEYTYTDLSLFFINEAKERFKEYTFVNYGLIDINKDPLSQGYVLHSYDVIVGANVLHDAINLNATLGYLKNLLEPNGTILIVEGTANNRLQMITVGFIEGFSHFEDERLVDNLPLLSVQKWNNILSRNGFERFNSFPEEKNPAKVYYQNVMIASGPKDAFIFDPSVVKSYVEEKLPDYMVPEYFILLNEFPLSANGKINKKALPVPVQLGQSDNRAITEAKTLDEKAVLEIWKKMFNKDRIDINDNFFEIGGDSLLAVRLVTELNKTFNIEISLQELFDTQTIALLAKIIEVKQAEKQEVEFEEGEL